MLATMPRWSATVHSALPRGLRRQVFAVLLAVHRHGGPGHLRLHEAAAAPPPSGAQLPKEMWLKVLSFLRPSDFFSLDRVPQAAAPAAPGQQEAAALADA